MPTYTSAGGAYVPGLNYDRTGATDLNGSYSGSVVTNPIINAAPVVITASATLSAAKHDHRTITYSNAAGGTLTLPPATGSGAVFAIFIGTTLTSGTFVVQVANSSDFFLGGAYTSGAAAATFLTANTGTTATESDTITFNRSTTGLGTRGDFIELTDFAANQWGVEADYASSGTAATPFSAAV